MGDARRSRERTGRGGDESLSRGCVGGVDVGGVGGGTDGGGTERTVRVERNGLLLLGGEMKGLGQERTGRVLESPVVVDDGLG
jgi:hypothetical protein